MKTLLWHRRMLLGCLVGLSVAGCPAPDPTTDPGAPGGTPGAETPGGPGGEGGEGGGETGPNNAPTAAVRITPNVGIRAGTEVMLDATGSTDPDGDELTFTWRQTKGENARFSETSGPTIMVDAPYVVDNMEVSFEVTVDDGRGGVATAVGSVLVEVADEFAGHPQNTEQYRDSLTSDEAYHFLRRTSFGAKPEDVARVVRDGLAKSVQGVMAPPNTPIAVQNLADSYGTDIDKRWLVHLIEGPRPLQERMTLFWHDRFATSRRVLDGRDANLSVEHWNMLRRNALGNYRVFLEDLTLDPLMLIWLDGANSPKDAPNENYAREFWELFTLGRDVLYTEADIQQGSLAFTGITLLRESGLDARPVFDIVNHDNTVKTIFPGRAEGANYDFRTVIDLTLEQPEAADYVARNLFEFFIHDHPSDETVRELADLFVESNFEIRPLVRKIISSRAFFSPEARGNQLASPVEHIVGVARTLDIHLFSEDAQGYIFSRLADDLEDAGQELMDPPGVEGWAEGLPWLSDQWLISRVEALGYILDMDYGPDRTPELPYHLLPDPAGWDQREVRREIVNAMADVFHLKLTEEEIDIYIEVLDQNGHDAFHLINPDRQPRHVFEMIRLMAIDEHVLGR